MGKKRIIKETDMFNLGFAEIMLILLIAFLVVGPRDLPKVARWLGKQVKAARSMISELKQEVGWDEFTRETDSVRQELKSTLKEADVRHELKETGEQLRDEMADVGKETMRAVKEAEEKK